VAANIYKNKIGKRLPSVTGIISRFKDSGGLLYWANQCGLDGKTLDEARRPAATAGTLAHAMVEARLRGEAWEPPAAVDANVLTAAKTSFSAYLHWESMNNIKIDYAEVALISDKHQFGGQIDAVGKLGDTLVMIDWKTSNAVYGDYLIQLAAYRQLWEENYPDHPITGGFHLCRFAKDTSDFAHHYYPQLDNEWKAFELMIELYSLDKLIKKRAA
jgi:hypothetical protein